MSATAAKYETITLQNLFEKQKAKSLELRTGTLAERKTHLKKLRSWLLANRESIREAVFADFRKPATEADISEVFPVVDEIGVALANLNAWVRPKKIDAPITYLGTRAELRYEPKGTCLIVGPWNYPFNLCVGPLVSCLAAGNTAILKPSEMTPHTSALIASMVGEIFPPELVAVVEGDAVVAQQLLTLPFDHIFFTGSPAVGKVVMRAAAEHLTSVTLELGGKSPAIIDATANLKDAARRIAFGKLLNNGQTCIAPDYVLIEEQVAKPFIALLQQQMAELFGRGNPIDEKAPDYMRIVNGRNFDRLHRLMQDAIERGAQPHMAGQPNRDTLFFPPTILTEVSPQAAVMEEEIFGPILPIVRFKQLDEALNLINEKPKPLSLYVFSSRSAIREEVLMRTSAGSVVINDCVIQFTHLNLPFGGVNNSGIGKSHGHYGFLAFSNEKPVLRQRSGLSNAMFFYPPYSGIKQRLVDFLLKWVV